MKSVSIVALEATVKSDGVEFAATGLSSDAESRDLLEDALRGVLAMWRLAVQEKSPELVVGHPALPASTTTRTAFRSAERSRPDSWSPCAAKRQAAR